MPALSLADVILPPEPALTTGSSGSTSLFNPAEVFEGPEKKLEVFFTATPAASGFRQFETDDWSALLADASCEILHHKGNSHFDSYLLSESSLFVYPYRVILKTCGTTTLLLVLPKLLALAARLGSSVSHVQYGHYRYKFPDQQLFPHLSIEQERAYLAGHFGEHSVRHRVLGPLTGCHWVVLSVSPDSDSSDPFLINAVVDAVEGAPRGKRALPEDGEGTAETPGTPEPVVSAPVPLGRGDSSPDNVFEIAMEGLKPEVCAQFCGSTEPELTGKSLALSMTSISGIGELLPGVFIDDWAFEPCGYSMNGLRDRYYYTIHVTPEEGFSYASFETNDPACFEADWVSRLVQKFAPSAATITLTSRDGALSLPSYEFGGLSKHLHEVAQVSTDLVVHCSNFMSDDAARVLAVSPTPWTKEVTRGEKCTATPELALHTDAVSAAEVVVS